MPLMLMMFGLRNKSQPDEQPASSSNAISSPSGSLGAKLELELSANLEWPLEFGRLIDTWPAWSGCV